MIKRRMFVVGTFTLPALYGLAEAPAKLRVAVIGHTGRGNYGHGLDTVWLSLPDTEIVGVADADAVGLQKAMERLKTADGFADYRVMLAQVKPDIVAICPRHADQHCEMALAACAAGVRGIYMEKPFCRSPAESDDIAAACQAQNVKLAVAHRNRYHPVLPTIAQLIKEGELGQVLEIRGRGKGDRRGGSEDLWVLGSHVLNLVHYFGGKATSCSAMIYRQGVPITKSDIVAGNEGLGPLAGDEVRARFRLASGLTAYFDSMANDGTESQAFGLQIIGSQGIIDFKIDREPLARICRGNPYELLPKVWVPIASTGIGAAESDPTIAARVANHQVAAEDLIASIHLDRQPQCGLADAVQTVEMISAVFESHRLGGQNVSLPLEDRRHPFARW